jgi:Plavaka transposase
MTGGRSAHPLLISLANISMEFRNKDLNNAYLLLALLPIPKFIHCKRPIRGMLEARLYHHCLDVVLAPLKAAAQLGVMLSDPLGNLRWCFTPLASFIVDTPEAQLISCVGGKTSPVTMANYDQFGDDFRHPSRTGSITINTINKIRRSADAMESLETYEKVAKSYRLNGVQLPFWRDWSLSSDPSSFLTSEPLHHWHKQFWDHDTKWCIYTLGAAEIDFRFSVLHNRSGYRHFREGISSLKQVTGREQRDIQRYIIVVIADAVPPQFLVAIRALLDFRYFAQSPVINEDVCQNIGDALSLFHQHKEAILDAGARRGKRGKINNWHIPKLELFQSVVSNIRLNGVACQWSADFTEHAHIKVVKEPGRSSNNRAYETQICRSLDRLEKVRNFSLFTSIREAGVQFGASKAMEEEEEEEERPGTPLREDFIISTTSELLPFLWTSGYDTGTSRVVDYFYTADLIKKGLLGANQSSLQPPRTYQCAENIVYHLIRDPFYSKKTIAEAAQLYNIPDLPAAIGNFILHITSDPTNGHINSVGGRRHIHRDSLPVSHLQIWKKARIQMTTYHHPHSKLTPYTINAAPPSSAWPYGQFDSVIFNIDPSKKWPQSGLLGKWEVLANLIPSRLIFYVGHIIVDICLIFRIMPSAHPFTAETLLGHQITGQFLAYVRRYDILPQRDPANHTQRGIFPDPNTGLFLLKRATRSNGEIAGDIIPLNQLRSLVDIAPRFGRKADPRLTNTNSLSFATEFWLNKYFDKELFYALS